MATTLELRQQRANIWEQAKKLQELAEGELRDLTAEEQKTWDQMMADIDALGARVERQERAERIEREMNGYQSQTGADRDPGNEGTGDDEAGGQAERDRVYRETFGRYLRGGREALTYEQRQVLQGNFQALKGGEGRALTTLTGSSGGYTVPDGAMAPFTRAMIDWGGVRRARTEKITTSDGRDIPYPTGNDTGNTGRRISENKQVAEASPTFGGKVLRAYIYTSDEVLVPFALLEDTEFDIESFLMTAFGERIGRIQNSEDTTGTGDSMPEGLTVVTTVGKTADAAADVDFDELIDLELSVYGVYRQAAEWMFNTTTLGILRKKVDNNNRPLWSPGIAGGTPDRIWNYPYVINEDMPDVEASAKPIAFGDMSYFKLRDVRGIQVLRLVERYADYGQVGFLAFHRHDAKYIDAGTHPIKVLQQAGA